MLMTLACAIYFLTSWWRKSRLLNCCQLGSVVCRRFNKPTDHLNVISFNENRIIYSTTKRLINITSWKACPPFQCCVSQLNVLIEFDYRNGISQTETNQTWKELLLLPQAWKKYDFLGVIFKTTFDHFYILSSAFLQDLPLTMGTKWPVTKISTINLKGVPESDSLMSMSLSSHSCNGKDHGFQQMVEDFEPLLEMDKELFGGSNESLAESYHGSEPLISEEESEEVDKEEEEELSIEDESSESSNEGEAVAGTSYRPQSSHNGFVTQFSDASEENGQIVLSDSESNKSDDSAFNERPIKPPNVVIYTGHNKAGPEFDHVKHRLYQCLESCSYTVYFLSSTQITKVPWSEHTALLVIFCDNLDEMIRALVLEYCHSGGKCLNFFWGTHSSMLSSLQQSEIECQFLESNVFHSSLESYLPRIIEANFPKSGKILIYQQDLLDNEKEYPKSQEKRLEVLQSVLSTKLGLLCGTSSQEPKLTPCYLLHETQDKLKSALKVIENKLESGKLSTPHRVLHFVPSLESITDHIKPNYLPIITSECPPKLVFDSNLYFSNLKTCYLGKPIFFTEVLPTTMNLLESFSHLEGALAIASYQTQGKGRSGNQWLSPKGSAMFTIYVTIAHRSRLGQAMSFLQHLAGLAIVHSIRNIPELENLDVRIKWPNDIYYGKKVKLGGVVVNTTMFRDTFHCNIGCGINVSNSHPTMCLNDLILDKNLMSDTQIPTLSIEEVIAMSVTNMEKLIDFFQKGGPENCLPLYYKYWLHSKQQVLLEEFGEQAVIEGLDEAGFLRVETMSGKQLSLQPDGNSFDLLKNLITIKTY